ncbi:MAG: hypothetical protein ACKVPJ_02060 [Chitinophagales bacterium]
MSVQQVFQKHLLFFILFVCVTNSVHAETIERSYAWKFEEKNYSHNFKFSTSTYNYYKKIKRRYDDFTYYMHESSSYEVVATVANTLKNIAQKERLSDFETVEFISAFVQYMNYKDDGQYEYPRFPVETLVEMAGDCEDTAILLASILQYLGYKTVLISPKGHMGVGIAVKENVEGNAFPYSSSNFYYIETTSAGWGVGDYPEHLSAEATIYDPGQKLNAREVSTTGNYYASAENKTTNQQESKTQTRPSNYETGTTSEEKNTKPAASSYTYSKSADNKNSYTIEEDVIIINGERETMITKGTSKGDELEVTATSK